MKSLTDANSTRIVAFSVRRVTNSKVGTEVGTGVGTGEGLRVVMPQVTESSNICGRNRVGESRGKK
jgi:hypothetical protein